MNRIILVVGSGNVYSHHRDRFEIDTNRTIEQVNEAYKAGCKIIDFDIEFLLSIGEESGIYINGDMIKTDDEFLEMITKLKVFYEKFKVKWSKVLASRKKTIKTGK